ncbi:MAG: hypothetical protein U5K27_01880 [Desulfotignum sp.]|nr:hypothetical protein [Desulfotignum sp.]
MGFAVKLDTNGTRPDLLAHLLDRSLWIIRPWISKPDRIISRHHETGLSIEAIHESMDIIMAKAPAYEFRTTCVRPFIDTGIMKEIARRITGAQRYVLQNCSRDVQMLDPHFSQQPDRFFSDKEICNFNPLPPKRCRRYSSAENPHAAVSPDFCVPSPMG